MKTCRECGSRKPLDEFYKHKRMADGHLNKCKSCVKDRVSRRRADDIDRVREYDKQRSMLPHRVAARSAYQKTDAGKAALARARANYYRRYPEKRSATIAVGNAVRDGRLVKQPCEVCGMQKVEAHHHDYSKPLDVTWLCKKHHAEEHRSR